MLKRYYGMTLFLVFTQVLLFGCARPPTEEMIKAEKAVDEAREKEAGIYAQDIFRMAEESFIRAKEFIAARKYNEARQIAIETAQLARQAVTIAEINKEEQRRRIEALQHEAGKLRRDAREAIDELKSVEKKSFRKRAVKKYEELQEMIITWETDLDNIKDSAEEDKMIESVDELKKLIDEIGTEKQNMQFPLKKRGKR